MNTPNSKHDKPEPEGSSSLEERPLPIRRPIWKPVLLSLVIFASGAIVGTCSTLMLIRNQVHYRIHHPEEMPGNVASRLQRKLDLSDVQTEQVLTVLTERQQAIQQIRRDFQPKLEAELDQLEKQIGDLLDDSQSTTWRQKFQAMRAEWLPAAP